MKKVELIIEAADLMTFYAEPGIEKVVVFQQDDNKVVASATIEEDLVDKKEEAKKRLISELSDKLSSVSETEELEYLLAA